MQIRAIDLGLLMTPHRCQLDDSATAVYSLPSPGMPYHTYVILVTSDLMSWSPIITNRTGANGTFDFTDNQSTNAPQRFYRAVSSP